MPTKKRHVLLVVFQFGGIFYFIASAKVMPHNVGVALLFLGSILLGIWAVVSMNRDTLSVLPDARVNGSLITNGPYSVIRHPMYTAVLTFLLSILLNDFSFIRLLVLSAVLVVLLYKIEIEETILKQKYSTYASYCNHTKRLIPFFF